MHVLAVCLLAMAARYRAAAPIVVTESRFDKGGGIYTSTGVSYTMYSDLLSRTWRIWQTKATTHATQQQFAHYGHNGFSRFRLTVNGITEEHLEYRHGRTREWTRSTPTRPAWTSSSRRGRAR